MNGFMKRTLIMVVTLLTMAAGCGKAVQVPPSSFPEIVELKFNAVDLTGLQQTAIYDSWKLTKTVPFGVVQGGPVSLVVYQESDVTTGCSEAYERILILEYDGETYRQPGCISSSLEEADSPGQSENLVLLNTNGLRESAVSILLGAVDIGINGPGLMAYYVYDPQQERWYFFEQWGYPSVLDLDGDGVQEIALQFRGLHMHPPSVAIGRWREGQLEVSRFLSDDFDTALMKSAATIADGMIEVDVFGGSEGEDYQTARYRYEQERLIRDS